MEALIVPKLPEDHEEGRVTACSNSNVADLGAGDSSTVEARALDLVVGFHNLHGRFPTYREVRIELADRSLRAAYHHVQELKDKGWLTTRRL